jgi:hypothetical protein
MPFGVVEILPNYNAFILADQVGVQVELALGQLEAKVSVALSDGNESVTKSSSELHVKLVALDSVRRHLDVRIARERKGGSTLASLPVESVGAGAARSVIRFAKEPWSASSTVEAHDVFATAQSHRAVFAAPTRFASAVVVRNVI